MYNTIIRGQNIKVKKNDRIIFDNLNFEIYQGEILGVIGRLGSGKSFISDIICGEYNSYAGNLYQYEKLVRSENFNDSKKVKVIRIQQKSSLIPTYSIAQNLIPIDMLNNVLYRASNPLGLENKKDASLRWLDWEEVLGVACGLWKRHYHESEKGDEYKLALEECRMNRDYLYGRLLAVADKLEQYALNENEKNRPTNAIRYLQVFSQKPYSTWKMITELLQPYIIKLGSKAMWYQNLLDEIGSKFEFGDFVSNDSLKGAYLLGYYCQRKAIDDQITKWAEKNKQKEDNENESDK